DPSSGYAFRNPPYYRDAPKEMHGILPERSEYSANRTRRCAYIADPSLRIRCTSSFFGLSGIVRAVCPPWMERGLAQLRIPSPTSQLMHWTPTANSCSLVH